jgi:hypothetical protein
VTVAVCPPPRRGLRDVLRGVWFALLLLAGAADALLTAAIGMPRLGWLAGRIGRALADEYHRGLHDAIDGEVIEDADDMNDSNDRLG